MDPAEKPEATSSPPPSRLDCIKCFDMLWSCYSPFHQMQNYYRQGVFDNCFGKWGDLVDCLTLKTKPAAEVDKILIAPEKEAHIWTFRTVDEASMNWWQMYKHVVLTAQEPHIWTYRTVDDDEASMNWWRMYKHVVLTAQLSGPAKLDPKSDKS